MHRLEYPFTPTTEHVDELHGSKIPDPYRWLEDPNSPQTRAWIEAQNALACRFLQQIPARERLRERLTELWNYPKATPPFKRGGRYFSFRNSGLQNHNVLYVQESLDAEPRVLLDPNALSSDGTVALNSVAVSRDGNYLAYALAESGSDWLTWRVREVATGQDLPDELRWSKFSLAAWLPDGSGFFYSRYDEPKEGESYTGANYFQKVYLHRVGTPQSEDVLVYGRPDQQEWGFWPQVTHDGRYLVLRVWKGTHQENLIFYRDLQAEGPFIELIPQFEADFTFIGNVGTVFYFKTDLDAPRGRIIAIDTENPAREHWKTIVPEGEDLLEQALFTYDRVAAVYLHHAHHRVRFFGRDGTAQGALELPTLGSLFGLSGEPGDPELFFGFTSFLFPLRVYRHDLSVGQTTLLFDPPLTFDPEGYETRQVFVRSKDGTRVPMFLVHRKGLEPSGQNPTLLYGYGGFNVPLVPNFDPARLAWFEAGGIYAQANLRGGGEYGKEWYRAGTLHQKQNVFDDFIACAEWLIENRWTSPSKLAIQGASNGGLLVGAVMTQRPELFGAALPAVGVMDMLRFHKFTIGWAWVSDYGSPDDPEMFETLLRYSPLHNLKPGTAYPATLITTADHDDRVVPAHSFKFAAALQAAQGGEAPVLIRIQTKAGHGLGKPTRIVIEEKADIYAFLFRVLGLEEV
ncbi:prolyl oligopeptidase family serine peptidase [Allomeiothermus silvanus]|uniref:prolyl oligopeptidase family serine peptidase n=1 Tax=Allomeiothermus silvanus TaxID=52022 RepID=UPI0023F17714|nr:prolyl oligopeptidase family serine peptidase [Allomeiothermus silvanus]